MFGDILIRVCTVLGDMMREETLSYKAAMHMAEMEWHNALGEEIMLQYFCATSGMELNRMVDGNEVVGFCGIPDHFYERPLHETLH